MKSCRSVARYEQAGGDLQHVKQADAHQTIYSELKKFPATVICNRKLESVFPGILGPLEAHLACCFPNQKRQQEANCVASSACLNAYRLHSDDKRELGNIILADPFWRRAHLRSYGEVARQVAGKPCDSPMSAYNIYRKPEHFIRKTELSFPHPCPKVTKL